MTKTLEAVVRRRWLPPEYAVKEVVAFERRFGEKSLALACHAALPLILTPELVNLIRINFLEHENIPWITESDLLLSPLCRPIQEDIYEVEPCVREVLLVELEDKFGEQQLSRLAGFLQFYLEKQSDWKQHPELTRTQKWIAQAYLNPNGTIQEIKDELEKSLPQDNPILGLPDQSYLPYLVEILAGPLERTNLWNEHQYLVNTTRALAKLLSGEREGLKEEIGVKEVGNQTGEGELMVISPAIRQLIARSGSVRQTGALPAAMVQAEDPKQPVSATYEGIEGGTTTDWAVILTALGVEHKAVEAHLKPLGQSPRLSEEIHPNGTIYTQGQFKAHNCNWNVAIAQIDMGNASAAMEAVRAIERFQPRVVLFVGVAGGIKDVKIGDVVAASVVYGYECGKLIDDRTLPRPKLGEADYDLKQRAQAEARKDDWREQIRSGATSSETTSSTVYVKPIAAGEKVIASRKAEVYDYLREYYDDAIAVEMEGIGFLKATQQVKNVSAMVIRGISDLINGKNDDLVEPEQIRQEKAARHASAFAFEILAKINGNNNLSQETQNENSRLTHEISKLREQDTKLQEEENRYRDDLERLNTEIKQQENESVSLAEEVKSFAPQHTVTASNWLAKRKEIAKEAVQRVFDDNSSRLKEMIIETGLPPDKTFEGFCNEIEIYLEKIYYYTLSDNKNLLENPGSPVYLPVTAYQQVLTIAGMMACEEIGEDGQQVRVSLENLISHLC
jgi:nucleoside phosphorylase